MRESYSILCEFVDINHSPDPGKVGQRISEIPPEKSRTTREFSNSMYLPTYDSKITTKRVDWDRKLAFLLRQPTDRSELPNWTATPMENGRN